MMGEEIPAQILPITGGLFGRAKNVPPMSYIQIDRVIYILHPTFPSPVREVKDRSIKFRLKTAGWGVFLIRATVKHKDGKETLLTHYLTLEYPGQVPSGDDGG